MEICNEMWTKIKNEKFGLIISNRYTLLRRRAGARFSHHPRHSNLSSVHLPGVLAVMFSLFIDKLPPCLSKHL